LLSALRKRIRNLFKKGRGMCLHQNKVICIKGHAHQCNAQEDEITREAGSDKEALGKQDNPGSWVRKGGFG
jgi:hypothetical protein